MEPADSPPFETASAVVPAAGESGAARRYAVHVPDGWQQGPGAFGGVVVGALVRAMEHACGDADRMLRTIASDIVTPVQQGAAAIDVEVLRRGKGMTTIDARMLQGDAVVARASASFGSPRSEKRRISSAPPDAVDLPEPASMGPPLAPVYTQHYEYRALPPFPFDGATEARASGFVRARAQPPRLDAAHVIALLDAWWPTWLALESGPRALTTVGFSAQIIVDPRTLDAHAPFRFRAHAMAAADGYVVEARELWQNGALVALNQQTFVIVR